MTLRSQSVEAEAFGLSATLASRQIQEWARSWTFADETAWLNPAAFHTQHPGGGNFLFLDGSVKFIKNSVDLDTMRALCTRNYAEVVSSDAY